MAMHSISRRAFMACAGAAGLATWSARAATNSPSNGKPAMNPSRAPDQIVVVTEQESVALLPARDSWWEQGSLGVRTIENERGLAVTLRAPSVAVKTIQLTWRGDLSACTLMLGDQWERAYGDLAWAPPDPARLLPWYVLAYNGSQVEGYGVMTQPSAFCAWRLAPDALTLTADVRCGGRGVQLGERLLDVCIVVAHPPSAGESPFEAARGLCRQMCAKPRLVSHAIYGTNDWYHTYGEGNSSAVVLEDARFISALAPAGAHPPYTVVDCGWQLRGGVEGGPWDQSSPAYPDMPGLAAEILKAGARPGIWIRPLAAAPDHPGTWRLARDRAMLDPTVPEVREQVIADIARLRAWKYELIKHDFTTFDITGRWGPGMGAEITADGWSFANRGVTTAEAISDLYRAIREASGDGLILGCNTVSHLAAGLFELARIGDDVSGKEWARTRQMGVNALAFRAPQHNAFYAIDADCFAMVSLEAVPWAKNRQWLDLLAKSGTPLFLSVTPKAVGAEQERAIRDALALAVQPQPIPEPLDWMETRTTRRWRLMGAEHVYDWS